MHLPDPWLAMDLRYDQSPQLAQPCEVPLGNVRSAHKWP